MNPCIYRPAGWKRILAADRGCFRHPDEPRIRLSWSEGIATFRSKMALTFRSEMIPDDFGVTLASARSARGWTQGRLARACGVRRETISRLEAGRRRPTADVVFRLQAALDLEPGELVPTWPEWSPVGLPTQSARTRDRRRERRIPLRDAAAAAGVSIATLSRFERGVGPVPRKLDIDDPDPPEAAKLALAQLLGFADVAEYARHCRM